MKEKLLRVVRYILFGIQPKVIKIDVSVKSAGNLLNGRRILITGGGRGLGYYIAKRCSEEGAFVTIVGRNEKTLAGAATAIKNCKYISFDVSNIEGFSSLFDTAEELLGGPIDSLVNNAGISLHEGNIMNVTPETFDCQIKTNLCAPYFLTKEYILRFKKNKLNDGNILFITSERGLYCDDIPYGLIKAAINSLTQGLGRRLINDGIRVNAIAPGVTASDMTGYKREGNLYRPQACGERVYLPEEIAETALFILSNISGCISSQIIPCNRGNHLRCDW